VPYVRPTFFGIAYASRLFRQQDYQSTYQAFSDATSPLDFTNASHAEALRTWLNQWGCRISKQKPISRPLANWARNWTAQLPHRSLRDLREADVDLLGNAYWELRNSILGPAAAAKAMFALQPETAIPWDQAIRDRLGLKDNRDGYPEMLRRSRQEANFIVEDASKLGISESDIPKEIGSPGRTLARLLDEYHWITLTQGHQIPSVDELKLWLSWICPPEVNTKRTDKRGESIESSVS
jgi:hypothetical protein